MKNENTTTQTKEQKLLRAFKSKETLDEFLDSIPNDEEYQAWKAAHPERDSKWDGMTREQKNEYIVELILKIAEKEQQRQKQEKHEQLRELLRHQSVPVGETWDTIREYCQIEQANPVFKDKASNDMMLLLDMFEFGKIYGIRQERARRKGEQV